MSGYRAEKFRINLVYNTDFSKSFGAFKRCFERFCFLRETRKNRRSIADSGWIRRLLSIGVRIFNLQIVSLGHRSECFILFYTLRDKIQLNQKFWNFSNSIPNCYSSGQSRSFKRSIRYSLCKMLRLSNKFQLLRVIARIYHFCRVKIVSRDTFRSTYNTWRFFSFL